MRPDEAEKAKSKIKERGSFRIIAKVTVRLNEKCDTNEACRPVLESTAEVSASDVKRYEKHLVGGFWCIIPLDYFHEEGQKGSPFFNEEIVLGRIDCNLAITGVASRSETSFLRS